MHLYKNIITKIQDNKESSYKLRKTPNENMMKQKNNPKCKTRKSNMELENDPNVK